MCTPTRLGSLRQHVQAVGPREPERCADRDRPQATRARGMSINEIHFPGHLPVPPSGCARGRRSRRTAEPSVPPRSQVPKIRHPSSAREHAQGDHAVGPELTLDALAIRECGGETSDSRRSSVHRHSALETAFVVRAARTAVARDLWIRTQWASSRGDVALCGALCHNSLWRLTSFRRGRRPEATRGPDRHAAAVDSGGR